MGESRRQWPLTSWGHKDMESRGEAMLPIGANGWMGEALEDHLVCVRDREREGGTGVSPHWQEVTQWQV